MFCPQCGQSQPASEIRFCTRCGIGLQEIGAWLARAQQSPAQLSGTSVRPAKRRNKGTKTGAKLMFISGVLFPLALALSIFIDEPGPLVVPITVFFAGLALLLYSKLFGEEDAVDSMPASIPPPRANPQLEQGHFNRVSTDWARKSGGTAEMAQPPSVTEHTTVFFDKE